MLSIQYFFPTNLEEKAPKMIAYVLEKWISKDIWDTKWFYFRNKTELRFPPCLCLFPSVNSIQCRGFFYGTRHKIRSTKKMDDLLTVAEVAAILRVDATTVRRWVKYGILAAVSLPHAHKRQSYRIKRATLQQLLESDPSLLLAEV
jgi:excisionase family DNA binding protein